MGRLYSARCAHCQIMPRPCATPPAPARRPGEIHDANRNWRRRGLRDELGRVRPPRFRYPRSEDRDRFETLTKRRSKRLATAHQISTYDRSRRVHRVHRVPARPHELSAVVDFPCWLRPHAQRDSSNRDVGFFPFVRAHARRGHAGDCREPRISRRRLGLGKARNRGSCVRGQLSGSGLHTGRSQAKRQRGCGSLGRRYDHGLVWRAERVVGSSCGLDRQCRAWGLAAAPYADPRISIKNHEEA